MKIGYRFYFFFLIIAYVAIGYYSINHNAITSDEPAYLGAAYAYAQGIGLNQEHPLFLKLINSLLFFWEFPQLKVDIPDPSQLDSRAFRLAAFDVGYRLLMYFPEQFDRLIVSSRSLYLGMNSLLLFWLGLYSFVFKLINPKISLIFATLWVFSPSFSSHNSLIAFDVGVAVSALMTILSTAIAVYSVTQLTGKYLIWQFLILTISLTFAINTKFSNLLLLPIVLTALIITSFYLFKTQKKTLAIKFTLLSCTAIALQPFFIWAMYRFAFRQLSNQSLSDIIGRYLTGIDLTLITAKGEQIPFLWGQFRPVNYGQYLTSIIWFKENPWLFFLLGIILFATFKLFQKSTKNASPLSLVKGFIRKLTKNSAPLFKGGVRRTGGSNLEDRTRGSIIPPIKRSHLYLGLLILLIAAYPLTYAWLAKGSHFVIGYRYFYPVLLFLYFLIAVLAISLQSYYSQKLLIIGLILYSLTGAIAVPQTLSYVNPLWLQNKWLLANDSTLNWGQENRRIAQYLLEHQLIPKKNQNSLIQQTFGVVINVNQYLEILAKQKNYPLDIQSYYQAPAFEPLKQEIEKLSAQYLLIDSSVKQQIYANRQSSPSSSESNTLIATKNWDYLQKNTPIYTHNDIIFLYQLR